MYITNYNDSFQDKLKLVTILGAGLLVGTALAVIIPEGIHAMSMGGEGNLHISHVLPSRFLTWHQSYKKNISYI